MLEHPGRPMTDRTWTWWTHSLMRLTANLPLWPPIHANTHAHHGEGQRPLPAWFSSTYKHTRVRGRNLEPRSPQLYTCRFSLSNYFAIVPVIQVHSPGGRNIGKGESPTGGMQEGWAVSSGCGPGLYRDIASSSWLNHQCWASTIIYLTLNEERHIFWVLGFEKSG